MNLCLTNAGVLALAFIVPFWFESLQAGPGDVDNSFGTNGAVITELPDDAGFAGGLVELPDGKILFSGTRNYPDRDFVLARYTANGTLDSTFGSNGMVVTDFSGEVDIGGLMILQPDGKVVVGGYTEIAGDRNLILMRHLADGSLDTSFSFDGKAQFTLPGTDLFLADIALQSDGKILALGNRTNPGGDDEFVLVRFLANGSIDSAFGTSGALVIFFNDADAACYSVEPQPDGKILFGGRIQTNGSTTGYDFIVFRCLADGSNIDTSFGDSGAASLSDEDLDTIFDIKVQGDGKILLAGDNASFDVAVARLNVDGTPDDTFNGNGIFTAGTPMFATYNQIEIQPDGKALVSFNGNNSGLKPTILRLDTDGTLDSQFGDGGYAFSNVDANANDRIPFVLTANGDIIISGATESSQIDYDFFLTKLEGGESLEPGGFDAQGLMTLQIVPDLNLGSFSLQPDGKFLIAGSATIGGKSDLCVIRCDRNGFLDTTFSQDGIVTIDVSGDNDGATCIDINPDGTIVLGVSYTVSSINHAALVRLTPEGRLDSTFGEGGKSLHPSTTGLWDIVLQSDGSVVGISNGGSDFDLVRFLSDGSLDTTFGTGGIITFDLGSTDSRAYKMAVQPDDKLLMVGYTNTDNPNFRDSFIYRCLPDGTLDTSFNGDGKLVINLPGHDISHDVIVQADGKILIGGQSNSNNVGVVRLESNGVLDNSFSGDGIAAFTGLFPGTTTTGIALQPNGRIIHTGMKYDSGAGDFFLAATQFEPDGSTNVSFGTGGVSITSSVVNSNAASTALILNSGDILLGAVGGEFLNNHIILTKIAGDPTPRIQLEEPVGTILTEGGTPLDYGTVNVGETIQKTFTIRNVGNAALTGLSASLEGPNFIFPVSNLSTTTLAPDETTTFTVGFSPTAAGVRTAVLHLDSNDIGNSRFSVDLTGNGASPEIAVEEPVSNDLIDAISIRDFGPVSLGESISKEFTIRNFGDGVLKDLSLSLSGPNSGDMSATPLGATSLGPNESTSFTLTFSPAATGSRRAYLNIASNDSNENPFDIQLTGTGTKPEIVVEEPINESLTDGVSATDFGHVHLSQNSLKIYTIRNTGDAPLTGLALNVDGSHFGDFVAAGLSASSLAPNTTATFQVTFSPSALGNRNASVHIASNDSDENPFDISLSGVGANPEIEVEQPASVSLSDGASSIDFGSVTAGRPEMKTFTIRNTGATDLIDLGITFTGTNADDFSAGTLPSSIPSGGSTTVDISLDPSDEGPRTASMKIASNDFDENPFDIDLTGSGIIGEIVVEQPVNTILADGSSTIEFGETITGNPVEKSFTIRNEGSGDLVGLQLIVSGANQADFIPGNLGATTVATGESTTFTISFVPVGGGDRSAVLNIVSSDSDENPFEINLHGSAILRTTVEGWGSTFGLSGDDLLPDADKDGDGLSLLEEYAFILDPTSPDNGSITPGGSETGGLPLIRIVNDQIEVQFIKRRSDPDLVYEVQFGNAPFEIDFQPAVQAAVVSPINQQLERHTVTDSETTSTQSARFTRIRITAGP